MWDHATVKQGPGLFVSVIEDEKLQLKFTLIGQETLRIDGHEIRSSTTACRREERDIWYDPEARWRACGLSAAAPRSSTFATSNGRSR